MKGTSQIRKSIDRNSGERKWKEESNREVW